ncbi:MAG: PrsW family glutamic-type intramembrane protease [Pseudomonadota bacterium]|jgi:hypothetical protein
MNWGLYLNAHTPIAILPVVAFLAALIGFDSFKLMPLRLILILVVVGACATGASYYANTAVWERLPDSFTFTAFSRYVSPFIEEFLKGIAVVVLIRQRRVGLLVDAAIAGFAVGTGFALIENLYYLAERSEALLFVQVIRGFGTAIMHGGATATFATVSIAMQERRPAIGPIMFLPAFIAAAVLHSTFNHLLVQPVLATLTMAVVLPVVFVFVFRYSERALRAWMEAGLGAKMDMLRAIRSGLFLDSPAGQYLQTLRSRFEGETLADMLCYITLHGELALRAQGILMMRETGWDEPPIDADTRAKLAELHHVERAIGRTGLVALHPLMISSGKDLWQMTLLGQ